ncbi:MAG TPA: hypothetical protein VIO60_06620, partial [Rectinemataceae bacterium]
MNVSRPASPSPRVAAPSSAIVLALALVASFSAPAFAQDGSFGFGEPEGAAAKAPLELHGSIGAGASIYLDDPLVSGSASLGDLAWAR